MDTFGRWLLDISVVFLAYAAWQSLRAAVASRDMRYADLAGLMIAIVLWRSLPTVSGVFLFLHDLGFASVPFWLLRLAERVSPVPRWLQRLALAPIVVLPVYGQLHLGAAFVDVSAALFVAGISAYVARLFTRACWRTSGVTSRRLSFAAFAAWCLVLGMVALAATAFVPAVWRTVFTVASRYFRGLTVIGFFLAFQTPRDWRTRWQRLEQARYLNHIAERDAEDRGAHAADDLLQATTRALNSALVLVALRGAAGEVDLIVRASSDPALAGRAVAADEPLVADALRHGPMERAVPPAGSTLATTLAGYGRRALVAPLVSPAHDWGVVIVVQRRQSLFAGDELALLAQFSKYAATALDHAALVAERRERDRRTAEQKLRDLETRTSLVLESVKDYALVMLDTRGRVVTWYPGAEHVFGYAAAAMNDQSIGAVIASSGAEVDALLEDARATGRTEREGPCQRRDGTRFTGVTTIRPLVGADIEGFVAVTRDVTAQRDIEDRLRQSQKMEAIGQLAGGIAHDFNNQLATIVGNADWLAFSVTTDEAREELAQIHKAAERAAGLTRQLLAFSRRQVVELVPVDVCDLIDDLLPMLRRLIGEHVVITHEREGGPLWIRADRNQMDQVIINLGVNARDAMPRGGQLRIATRLAEPAEVPEAGESTRPCVLLEVADTGVGIDPATQQRIFEPFFTTKTVGRGTGLGLATVYGIVQQMQGIVRVASRPGDGATFRLYLPSTEAPARVERSPADADVYARAGATVLLVEDDASVRAFLGQALEQGGYRVLAAENSSMALQLAATHDGAIDLLVTDVLMPGGTGPDLADALVAIRPHVPVLYVSGFADSVLGARAVTTSSAHFLQKPFSAVDFLRRVGLLLAHDDGDRFGRQRSAGHAV